MIIAARLDGRGRCSFDCICVCMNTLLLVARAAWHMMFRRHCCRLDRKARKSRSHRRAGQDQSTRTSARAPVDHKTKQRSHRSGRIMNSGLLYHPPGTNDDKQKAIHGTLSTSRRQKCAMPILANTQRNVQNHTGMIGEFAHAALSFSPCRSTRDGRDGVTQRARGAKKAECVQRVA